MSTAVLIEIATAVTTALTGGTFSQAIAPVRSYADWDDALEDFGTLHVDVVPVQQGQEITLETRGEVQFACEVDIGVRYRFGTTDESGSTGRVETAKVDALVLLVQEIAEFFCTDRLSDTQTSIWETTDIKQTWSRKHLRELRQFFGFVRLKFTATKTL